MRSLLLTRNLPKRAVPMPMLSPSRVPAPSPIAPGRLALWLLGASLGVLVAPVEQAVAEQYSGRAGGRTSIPDAIAGTPTDRTGQPCVGYASFQPNHEIALPAGSPRLRLQVTSGRDDTTLAVQGPDGTVLCGDDPTPGNPGAVVEIVDPSPGNYRIWVGSFSPGVQPYYQIEITN